MSPKTNVVQVRAKFSTDSNHFHFLRYNLIDTAAKVEVLVVPISKMEVLAVVYGRFCRSHQKRGHARSQSSLCFLKGMLDWRPNSENRLFYRPIYRQNARIHTFYDTSTHHYVLLHQCRPRCIRAIFCTVIFFIGLLSSVLQAWGSSFV